jgi:hypothetical protein
VHFGASFCVFLPPRPRRHRQCPIL